MNLPFIDLATYDSPENAYYTEDTQDMEDMEWSAKSIHYLHSKREGNTITWFFDRTSVDYITYVWIEANTTKKLHEILSTLSFGYLRDNEFHSIQHLTSEAIQILSLTEDYSTPTLIMPLPLCISKRSFPIQICVFNIPVIRSTFKEMVNCRVGIHARTCSGAHRHQMVLTSFKYKYDRLRTSVHALEHSQTVRLQGELVQFIHFFVRNSYGQVVPLKENIQIQQKVGEELYSRIDASPSYFSHIEPRVQSLRPIEGYYMYSFAGHRSLGEPIGSLSVSSLNLSLVLKDSNLENNELVIIYISLGILYISKGYIQHVQEDVQEDVQIA
jgi:hypothetical protein